MKITFRTILSDYFSEYRKLTMYPLAIAGIIAVLVIMISPLVSGKAGHSFLLSFPIAFSILSAGVHGLRIPRMMYLAPVSTKERTRYVRISVLVKILVPLAFTLLYDSVLLIIGGFNEIMIASQIISVVSIAFYGAVNNVFSGNVKYFVYLGLQLNIINLLYLISTDEKMTGDEYYGKRIIAGATLIFLYIYILPEIIRFKKRTAEIANYGCEETMVWSKQKW